VFNEGRTDLGVTGDDAEDPSHQYRDLLQNSGFRVNRIIAAASPFSIIEAAPTRTHAQPRHTVNT
jgi:hypothetical protein